MKLIFNKDGENQISVLQDIGGQRQAFSYVDMIKALIGSRKMEEPEILGKFTDAETTSIKRMVELINKEIEEKEEDVGDERVDDEDSLQTSE